MTKAVTVVGFDVGLEFTGVSITSTARGPSGRIVTPLWMGLSRAKSSPKQKALVGAYAERQRRVQEHVRFIEDVFVRFRPAVVTLEEPSSVRDASVMIGQGMVFGAIYAMAELRQLPVIQLDPKVLHKAVTGRISATKKEVQTALDQTTRMPLGTSFLADIAPGQWEHPYDALASTYAALDHPLMRAVLAGLEMP